MTLNEALPVLYAARANVARMAAELGMAPNDLKQVFRDYVREQPFDPEAWKKM